MSHPTKVMEVVGYTMLKQLGLTQGSATTMMELLRRGVDSEAVTIQWLIRHIRNANAQGALTDGSKHKEAGKSDEAKKSAAAGKLTSPSIDEDADASSISDVQYSRAILAWRALRPKLVAHYSEGAAQAFDCLDVNKQGKVTFSVWVTRLQFLGFVNKDDAIDTFGLAIDFKHSYWMPEIHANPCISR